jgi:hypothetical protein
MKNIQIRTVNDKSGQPLYTENLNNVIVFLKHSEDKIIISSKEQVEIEIQNNGKTLFLGTKTELFELLRTNKEEKIFYFEDWVSYMLNNTTFEEQEIRDFKEHYQNLLGHAENGNLFYESKEDTKQRLSEAENLIEEFKNTLEEWFSTEEERGNIYQEIKDFLNTKK